ncbi:MAG: hypothetical protein ACE5JJ_06260 [Nitrospinota bacterium]
MRPLLEAFLARGMETADLLLLALALGIAALGLLSRLRSSSECRQLRQVLAARQPALAAADRAEKEAAAQLKGLIEHQRFNQDRIHYLRARRSQLARLPYELEQESENLRRWCRGHALIVRDDRREAMKDPAARARRS